MTPTTHENRREKLRARLKKNNLGGLLVSLAANRFYLSGFELHDPQCNESAGYLLVTQNGPDKLLTDPRYFDAAARIWPEKDVFIYTNPKFDVIRTFLKDQKIGTIGFEVEAVSYGFFEKLAGEGLMLTPTRGLVEGLRLVKDAEEIEAMRTSCALNHEVFSLTPSLLTPGKTEEAVAWELEQAFRNRGASELSFSTIVGVGPNAALPHAVPGSDVVRENELVLVDMGCRLADYCSDQTRTFWVGEDPSERFRTTVERVKEAQQAAIQVVRPGTTCREAYQAARKIFEGYGVEAAFTHSLGHGIGLETHEAPSLGPHSEMALKPGMVITIEPGLYDRAWGGVRWEYMVVVREDGCEIL
jgi:Xaa-Pro aminopeptidase